MAKKTIVDIEVAGQRVITRVDFNVPLKDGSITDDLRLTAALPTIKSIIDRGGRAVLISHMGRPAGTGFEQSLSLRPVATRLAELLGTPVAFPSNDCTDDDAAAAVNAMTDGQVLLLENLRFHAGEKTGDPAFAGILARLGDVFVNDAFGTCHRTDASMVALPKALAGKPRVAGLLVDREIRYFHDTLASPERPFVVVLGGAKVSDKLGAVEHMLNHADAVLIGGAMAYTFVRALGHETGESKVEENRIDDAKRMIELAVHHECELHIPFDHVASTMFSETAGDIEVFEDAIPAGYMGMDIGPKTQTHFSSILHAAKTIVWNGPMGVFEFKPFRVGTEMVARAIARATADGATSIVGGGDTASAVKAAGLADQITHISTGGGASLEMLKGARFESVDLLDDA